MKYSFMEKIYLGGEKMENKRNFRENGITLVALMVTIIILLILAGISIASLTGNGLFEKAKLAKEKQEYAEIEEEATLGDYENSINDVIAGNRDNITISKDEYYALKKKGTWELLASNNTTTAKQYTVEDLKKYTSVILICYNSNGNLVASTEVIYEIFKTQAEKNIYSGFNNGSSSASGAKYIDDNTVAVWCHTTQTGKSELYGIY